MKKDTTKKDTRKSLSKKKQNKNGKIPMRRCTGCNTSFPKESLIRVVFTPDMDLKLDANGKMNGRGAYLCKNEECLKKAEKSHGIERSLRKKVDSQIYSLLREKI